MACSRKETNKARYQSLMRLVTREATIRPLYQIKRVSVSPSSTTTQKVGVFPPQSTAANDEEPHETRHRLSRRWIACAWPLQCRQMAFLRSEAQFSDPTISSRRRRGAWAGAREERRRSIIAALEYRRLIPPHHPPTHTSTTLPLSLVVSQHNVSPTRTYSSTL